MPAHSTNGGGGAFCRELKPPPRSFYSAEGIEAKTPPNARGWVLSNCPLHKSKSGRSFSFNIETGAFHCFGCDARGGDVIDFLKLRDHIDFRTAARQLGAWRNLPLTHQERTQLERRSTQRKRERQQALSMKEAQRTERLALRDEIHQDTRLMKQLSAQLQRDVENETLWTCLDLAWNSRQLSERTYLQACGFEVHF